VSNKFNSLIYLASPYSSGDEAIKARRAAQVQEVTAMLISAGYLIFSPIVHSHLLVKFGLDGDWDSWKEIDCAYIDKADEVWILMLDGWRDSKGVMAEIQYAAKTGKRILFLEYQEVLSFNEFDDFGQGSVVEIPPARQIIGLTGYAQSGKDTLGKYLVEQKGFTRVSFADGVREALYNLNPTFGMYSYELRKIVDSYGWEKAKENSEVRELLQRMGTEVGRQMFGENVWIDLALKKAQGLDKIVFTDVRFPNEAEAIRKLGGKIIRIEREGVNAINSHISEKPISLELVDQIIHNDFYLEDFYQTFEIKWEVLYGKTQTINC
jgi:dephospho-CoA kinase